MKFFNKTPQGFTLIEIMVVIGIIGILSAILFANFGEARQIARDKARMTSLKELQLAIEFYKAQNGEYPTAGYLGCVAGDDYFAGPGDSSTPDLIACLNSSRSRYIDGLVPDFISVLPEDAIFEDDVNKGYYYRSNGNSFKLMALDVVEVLTINSFGDEFARCPTVGAGCASIAEIKNTYAVYSSGAESW